MQRNFSKRKTTKKSTNGVILLMPMRTEMKTKKYSETMRDFGLTDDEVAEAISNELKEKFNLMVAKILRKINSKLYVKWCINHEIPF